MEQYLSDRNQLHIFDNDNFSIIPKSIFSNNGNLLISCKNADISAVDNFFDNIAHPYFHTTPSAIRQLANPTRIGADISAVDNFFDNIAHPSM